MWIFDWFLWKKKEEYVTFVMWDNNKIIYLLPVNLSNKKFSSIKAKTLEKIEKELFLTDDFNSLNSLHKKVFKLNELIKKIVYKDWKFNTELTDNDVDKWLIALIVEYNEKNLELNLD